MTMFRNTLLATGLCLMAILPAAADTRSETYVKENATLVLQTLADPTLDAPGRTEKFNEYMDQFSNLDRISSFVIGKYSRRFSDEDLADYRAAFREYSLTTYEVQFDAYRGSDIEVTGSTDRNERDSIVDSVIRRSDGEYLDVRWRVLARNDGFEVVDVALNIDGNLLWLGIEQRAQFLDLLDRNNGSAEALIAKLEELTADLRARQNG